MFSTRTSARFLACCLASALLITGCSSLFHHQHTTTVATGPRPTTQQLVAVVQKNFRTVSAFHVVMQVQNPGPADPNTVQIRNAAGDVVMPDKVKALATVILSGQSVQVNLISVGGSQFITDPITGQWRVIKGVLDPRTLTNPDTGLISLISKVQNLGQPIASNAQGVPCWSLSGQLDAHYLAFLTGGGVPAGTMLQTSACIGQSDDLPYSVTVVGQAAPGDTAQTTRIFDLSNYNENITINAPQVS